MKKSLLKTIFLPAIFLVLCFPQQSKAQTGTTIHGNYKAVTIQMDVNVPHSKSLILLHEIYNGSTLLYLNYVIGNFTALRGGTNAYQRIDVANVNTSSAYNTIAGEVTSYNMSAYPTSEVWTLKTCMYNGRKYLALNVPYIAGQHSNGYQFVGWAYSSAESLKFITYNIDGVPQNEDVLTNIQDYTPNVRETHVTNAFNVRGNVGIGIDNPTEKLSVNGKIRAQEIKVDNENWPDYVFDDDYQMRSLPELENYIKANKHLPGIPDRKEVNEEGIELGEMNRKLLEKVEELTLHLIRMEKEKEKQQQEIVLLKQKISKIIEKD